MQENMTQQIHQVIEQHQIMVATLQADWIDVLLRASKALVQCIQGGGCVYICGNGGSAADAQHIAGELVGRFCRDRRALAAVALTTDTSILTAVANDFSFDDIFVRQVEALVNKHDLLWAFSTSGASANVLKAAELAKARGATVLSFTGRGHSRLEQLSDICLCAEHASAARSQEIHQLAYHILCQLVETSCCTRET